MMPTLQATRDQFLGFIALLCHCFTLPSNKACRKAIAESLTLKPRIEWQRKSFRHRTVGDFAGDHVDRPGDWLERAGGGEQTAVGDLQSPGERHIAEGV